MGGGSRKGVGGWVGLVGLVGLVGWVGRGMGGWVGGWDKTSQTLNVS
jgi:hypothetical protein